MAGNKYSSELLLQGKFEFDQNSLSAAAQFTQELVKTIESPLQDMLKRVFGNLSQGLGQGFQGASFPVAGQMPTMQGQVPQHHPGFGPVTPGIHTYLGREAASIESNFGNLRQKLTSGVGTPYSPDFEARNMALMMEKAQKAGLEVYSSLSPEQREQFKAAAHQVGGRISKTMEAGMAEQRAFSEEIQKKEQLAEKAKAFYEERIRKMESSGASPEFLQQQKSKFESNYQAIQRESLEIQKKSLDAAEKTAAGIQELKRAKDALEAPGKAEQAEQAAKTMRGLGMVSTGLGIASSLAAFGIERPYALEEARAARAGMERGGARALLSGDITRYGLIQELGGEEALTSRSISSARGTYAAGAIGSLAAGGLVSAIGSGMISGIGAGAVGGVPGAIIGGIAGLGGAAYAGYKSLFEPEEKAKEYYEREISARAGQSQELRGAMRSSYDRLRGSFRTARDLGDTDLEAMLYGGSTSQVTSDQISKYQEALNIKKEAIKTPVSANEFYGAERGGGGFEFDESRADAYEKGIQKQKEAGVSTRPSEMDYYKRGLVRDPSSGQFVDLNTYGAKMGVDYSEVAAPLAGAFGRKYTAEFGQQAVNLKSLGIGPETIAGMGMGELRQDPRDAFNRVKDLYAEAMSTGIEKSQLPRAMEQVAQQAAQMGLGGAGRAAADFGRSTTLAGEMFGPGYNNAQLSAAQRAQQFMLGAGGRFGGGGIGGAMRFAGASRMMGEVDVGGGKTLKDLFGEDAGFAAEQFSKGGTSAETLRKMMLERNASEEQIAKAEESLAKSQGGLSGPITAEERKRRITKGLDEALGKSTLAGYTPDLRKGMAKIAGFSQETGDEAQAVKEAILKEGLMEKAVAGTTATAGDIVTSRGGQTPTTPGGAAVSSELGVKAAELNAALAKVIETVPSFTAAVTNAAGAINKGIEQLGVTVNSPAKTVFGK